MRFPKSILLSTTRIEPYALVLDTLEARKVAARCIEGALRLAVEFAAAPADVVVLDIEGLQQSVRELIDVLRERSAHVGIVVVGAPEQRDLTAAALCHGADVILTKPVSCAEVVEAIERANRRLRLHEAEGETGLSGDLLMKFSLGVADQVNNPLTTISGWLQVLSADHADDEQLAEMLNSIREEADRIAEVVRQLLAVAQQSPPREDKVNITKLLKELAHSESVKLKTKGIEVTTNIASPLPTVRGDSGQLRKACETILEEGESGLNGNGKIKISCKPKAQGVQITLRDNGPLLDAEMMESLFDPFEFGRSETGTGLGMYLARQIVQSHGGTIEVESTEANGTRFNIWLPAAPN